MTYEKEFKKEKVIEKNLQDLYCDKSETMNKTKHYKKVRLKVYCVFPRASRSPTRRRGSALIQTNSKRLRFVFHRELLLDIHSPRGLESEQETAKSTGTWIPDLHQVDGEFHLHTEHFPELHDPHAAHHPPLVPVPGEETGIAPNGDPPASTNNYIVK